MALFVFYHFFYRFSPLYFFSNLGFRHFPPHHMYLLIFYFWNLQHIYRSRGTGWGGRARSGRGYDPERQGNWHLGWRYQRLNPLFLSTFLTSFLLSPYFFFTFPLPFRFNLLRHPYLLNRLQLWKSVWSLTFKHFVLNFICVCFAFESIFISFHFHPISSLFPSFFLTEFSSSCSLRY